ncbi:MAG: hypothetical protein J6R63_05055 [Kiritimatiellae bacterium]|jgi:DNA-directed RNA polymerase subunit RPC12/RpoP|nr:hypothetical protein [Kiritimatiellia bacterium]
MEDIYFTSFVCDRCKTEIEASSDMIGQETECPACGAKIVIPDSRPEDGVPRHAAGDDDPDTIQALKSRTIRIDLGDF